MFLIESFLLVLSLGLTLFVFLSTFIFFFGPPFVPTPQKRIEEALKLARITKKDIVVDLGSGDGRMLIAAAKKGAQSQGWEINPFLVFWTKLLIYTNQLQKHVTISSKDYMIADLSTATVVFLYNLPRFMPQLEKKLTHELSPGTKIITYKFKLPTHTPLKSTSNGLFLYTIK
jgi:hypothetical protein